MLLVNDGQLIERNIRAAGLSDDIVLQAMPRARLRRRPTRSRCAVLEVDGTISIVPRDARRCARGIACARCTPGATDARAVSSGLGRNGPWLQNRVASRRDAPGRRHRSRPVALDGAFRPTERALASSSPSMARRSYFERCDYDVQPHEDALGRGRRLTLIASRAAPRRLARAARSCSTTSIRSA